MGSAYLQTGDLANYGVPNATSAQISQASLYIDGYLRRAEGLVWMPDCNGDPCYMSALTPSNTLTLAGALAPGANVVATVTGPTLGVQPGDILIADRANTGVTEALQVAAKTGKVLTFTSVQNAHSGGSLLDAGLDIVEQKYMPAKRPIINLSKWPLQRILGGIGRYAYPRRGDQSATNTDDFNLLAVYSQFGGPPAWEIFNPASCDFDQRTGQLWIPAGIMLAYYTEVRVRYVAGFSQANLPGEIKMACAKTILALINDPNLGPAKSYRAGDTAVTKFSDSMLSGDVTQLLNPYRARVMG